LAAQTAARVSTVAFIIAGAGTGVALYAWLMPKAGRASAMIVPYLDLGGAGLRGRFF
jgi:hypothetical protein